MQHSGQSSTLPLRQQRAVRPALASDGQGLRAGCDSNDREQQFQAIVGTNSKASWAGFMPIG
jgi:hypothetical protein